MDQLENYNDGNTDIPSPSKSDNSIMKSSSLVEIDIFNGCSINDKNDSVRLRKIKSLWKDKDYASYFEKTSIRRDGKNYFLWEV